jgi:HK97 family phage major capsid protein
MSSTVFEQISALGAGGLSGGLEPGAVRYPAAPGQLGTIFGKPVVISSHAPAFNNTTSASNVLVVGAFSRYCVAQRIGGVSAELVPLLRDPTTQRPTGQRGLLAFARYGAQVLDTASFVLLVN